MNPLLVRAVMEDGVGFVCAHCTNFWWGMARGLQSCKAAHDKKPCAGPINGDVFPEYEGELGEAISNRCFVCGAPADFGVVYKGPVDSRKVGVCGNHIDMLSHMSEEGAHRPRFITKEKVEVRE